GDGARLGRGDRQPARPRVGRHRASSTWRRRAWLQTIVGAGCNRIAVRSQPTRTWRKRLNRRTLLVTRVTSRLLEFAILGPLEVRVHGVAIQVGGPKQRALLALLLLSANRVVSRDRLVEELLRDQTTASAERALTVRVSRLRKALRADGDEPRLVA